MRKIIFALIAGIIGAIFLSIIALPQNEDSEELISDDIVNSEEQEDKPQGKNLSVQLDEKMGFSAP